MKKVLQSFLSRVTSRISFVMLTSLPATGGTRRKSRTLQERHVEDYIRGGGGKLKGRIWIKGTAWHKWDGCMRSKKCTNIVIVATMISSCRTGCDKQFKWKPLTCVNQLLQFVHKKKKKKNHTNSVKCKYIEIPHIFRLSYTSSWYH